MTDISPASDQPAEIVVEETAEVPAKRPANGTAIWALVLVILSYLAPIAIVIVGLVVANNYGAEQGNVGGYVIGGAIAIIIAAIVAIGLDFFGLILGVVAVFRKNRGKVLAIVAIVLGLIPLVVSIGVFTVFGSAIGTLGQ